MTDREGQCLCGAVRFVATGVPSEFGVCHCDMCRRWTGSALLGVTLPIGNVSWEGEDHITRIQSSSWAERAFCSKCGSGLWMRVTKDGPYSGEIEIPIGLFDDASGLAMTSEIYIDHKPDSFAFAGSDRKILTRQDCVDIFPVLDGD